MIDQNHDQPAPGAPLGITIPAASTDELLHALSATVINQQAIIHTMSGILLQVYGQVNQMPEDAVWALREQLFASSLASANASFIASLQERRQMLRDIMHQ